MRAQRAGHTGLYACGPELQARPECRDRPVTEADEENLGRFTLEGVLVAQCADRIAEVDRQTIRILLGPRRRRCEKQTHQECDESMHPIRCTTPTRL